MVESWDSRGTTHSTTDRRATDRRASDHDALGARAEELLGTCT